jgi:hypothetical protein
MKKLALTFAIVLGMTIGASAQGLFGLGASRGDDNNSVNREGPMINLPTTHGSTDDQGAPLGSGIAVLVGLGAAYAMSKKNKK